MKRAIRRMESPLHFLDEIKQHFPDAVARCITGAGGRTRIHMPYIYDDGEEVDDSGVHVEIENGTGMPTYKFRFVLDGMDNQIMSDVISDDVNDDELLWSYMRAGYYLVVDWRKKYLVFNDRGAKWFKGDEVFV